MASNTWNSNNYVTNDQRLDAAVASYWQRRYPGRPGRVILVDRTPATARKVAA